MSLYRPEALASQGDRLQGEILIVRSVSSWLLFWFGILTLAILFIFLCNASYTKRATADGILILGSGAVPLISPSPGRITEVRITEGQQVKKGEILFTISTERFISGERGDAYSEVMRLELLDQMHSLELERLQVAKMQHQDEKSRNQELNSLLQDMKLVTNQLDANEERLRLAQLRWHDYIELNKTLIVPNQAVQEQADSVSALNIQSMTYRRQKTEITRARAKIINDALHAPEVASIKINNLDRELSLRKQKISEQIAQGEWLIMAPINGRITSITGVSGQMITNQNLAVILPDNAQLRAHLFVTSKEIGFLEKGQRVKLRYQAFPYQKFGQYNGEIDEVSKSPLDPSSLPAAFVATNSESKYRVSVSLEHQAINYLGRQRPLVSGMTLSADVELENRLLIEWLIEPIYSLRRYE